MEPLETNSLVPILYALGFEHGPIARVFDLKENLVLREIIALRKDEKYHARPTTHEDALQAAWEKYL